MTDDAATAEPSTIALHKLPVQLRMLVRLMGEAAAFRLVERRGGTPFTVPKTLHGAAGQDLAEQVGPVAAAALVAELSAHTLQLPKYDSVMRQLRHQRVIALRLQARKLAEIALATGYSVRQVINILNAAQLPELAGDGELLQAAQLDMFGDGEVDANEGHAHNPFRLGVGLPPENGDEAV